MKLVTENKITVKSWPINVMLKPVRFRTKPDSALAQHGTLSVKRHINCQTLPESSKLLEPTDAGSHFGSTLTYGGSE